MNAPYSDDELEVDLRWYCPLELDGHFDAK